jgi:lipopolysaccharide biosynthesis regulator YciM
MAEYSASEDPASAGPRAERVIEILERIGARNDLTRAVLTRAALRQAMGDLTAACGLLDRADPIFRELGMLDEPARVRAALAPLDRARRSGYWQADRDIGSRPLPGRSI